MAPDSADANRLVIAGRVLGVSETRHSPAGLPMTRFVLEHQSRQEEAGMPRLARCRIAVLICGEALARDAARLARGTRVKVFGFVSRANYRHDEARLVVHAARIEILDPPENP